MPSLLRCGAHGVMKKDRVNEIRVDGNSTCGLLTQIRHGPKQLLKEERADKTVVGPNYDTELRFSWRPRTTSRRGKFRGRYKETITSGIGNRR